MKRIALIVLFLAALIGAALSQLPLAYVMKQSGLAGQGVAWTQVEGTIWKGRIGGLVIGDHRVGDAELELRPASLLTLSPTYDVQWGGAGGRGTGAIRVTTSSVTATDVRFEQRIAALRGLARPIRALGGSVRLNDGAAQLRGGGCESATGQVTSDVLARAAEQYGREFGLLVGDLSCDNGALLLDLQGSSEAGDTVSLLFRGALDQASSLIARVETEDRDIRALLANAGFEPEDGAWYYRRATAPPGGLQQ